MNEPKLPNAPVDAERVVRELLDAFKSLKTVTAPPTCSSPSEEEQQRPPQSQDGRSKEFEVVGGGLTTTSADPTPAQITPLEPLTGTVSDIEEGEPEKISAFESAENSETPDCQIEDQSNQYGIIEGFCRNHGIMERFRVTPQELQALSDASLLGSLTCQQDVLFMLRQIRETRNPAEIEAQSSHYEILEGFCRDHEIIERFRVTPQELQALSDASLLGSLTCKQDVLFMLGQIREARKPAESQAAVAPKKIRVRYHKTESSIQDTSEMSEGIRRAAPARLVQVDSLRSAEYRGTIWRQISTILNWRNHSSPNYRPRHGEYVFGGHRHAGYVFEVYPLDTTFKDDFAAVYIFSRQTTDLRQIPVYIGETDQLGICVRDHEQWPLILSSEATHICIHGDSRRRSRRAKASDLVARYCTACNLD